MFCSKCGTEIPEGASVCPNCGAAASSIEATNEVTKNNKPPKKKMSKGKKALVIVGVIAALLIFIGIISAIGSEGGSDVPDTSASTEADADANAAATEKSDKSGSGKSGSASVPTTKAVSKEYRNALKKAKSYSDMMHMSKKAIYDQLTSEYGENFPADAAQYAIDNLKADYKYNALQKAKSYQDNMSMSKSAIYDQLISEYGEQFTAEEAQYAIDNLPD